MGAEGGRRTEGRGGMGEEGAEQGRSGTEDVEVGGEGGGGSLADVLSANI